jgi:predicted ABC-type ATPase
MPAEPEAGATTPPSPTEIIVLAGVNGAGKSSIGGAHLRARAADYFNPDEAALEFRQANPGADQKAANAVAWEMGKRGLERVIREGGTFALETTLGGKTITSLLIQAAQAGARVHVWYAGLENVALHLKRVRDRVAKGGHDIPEEDIRRRWNQSHLNLILLIPHVTTLRVYDNSAEADPHQGKAPAPRMVLEIVDKALVFPPREQLAATPPWAKPIVLAAYKHFMRPIEQKHSGGQVPCPP